MTEPGFYAQDKVPEDGYYYMRIEPYYLGLKPKHADRRFVYFGKIEGHTFYYSDGGVEYLGRIERDVEFYGPINVPPSPWKEE